MDQLQAFALQGIGEITEGTDLGEVIREVSAGTLRNGDILVVSSKIFSKAEGRLVRAEDREEAITQETVRVVATRTHPGGVTRIVENRNGIIAAAAGVDTSNTAAGTVLLLPLDPDASARRLCRSLRKATGLRLGIIMSDTLGRPWRQGQTDAAIGAAGVQVLEDLRGTRDRAGHLLKVSVPAVGDEIAAAADLVKGKAEGAPVAVVRGLSRFVVDDADLNSTPGAASLVRPAAEDMFRQGSEEAYAAGYAAGLAARPAGD
ncbi:coenzyme F420-0:L-glutamate ligase [Arthrobacter sp. MSA 4-2]|uniref:coenzyme F420-0:L-glutamate ligase n=1 Tax=Arthrobacter sp. MSA 4-2 TaxID=2794349 RepID=UPI0018E7148B|nr:coenzyme F420-0:L-glutamate ligase [Arthrobacter sp. MSA 4-2]MBJ2122562.1 coenzyme F420-0:L-glutamate ligase [Arthrobacter sp. MSA 4-2]